MREERGRGGEGRGGPGSNEQELWTNLDEIHEKKRFWYYFEQTTKAFPLDASLLFLLWFVVQSLCNTLHSLHSILLLILLLTHSSHLHAIVSHLLMRCVMWCDVMWCDVMWCDVMWCDVMCVMCVMWCDVMWCVWWRVMWCVWCRVKGYLDWNR